MAQSLMEMSRAAARGRQAGAPLGVEMPPAPPRPANPFLQQPQLPQPTPGRGLLVDPSVLEGEPVGGGGVQYDGPQLNTEAALSGLASMQGERSLASPFGEMELFRLAARDPQSVQPGSNQYWGSRLKETVDRSATMQGAETDALKGIRSAIGSLHPAVQEASNLQARRASLPASITARGQLAAAQTAANAREYAAELEQDEAAATGKAQLLSNLQTQIGNIQRKPTRTAEDTQMLQILMGLYNSYSQPEYGVGMQNPTEE